MSTLAYLSRIIHAYLFPTTSQLAFWHQEPKLRPVILKDKLGPYYMDFDKKADYDLYLDEEGIPRLDYKGMIGVQYNPIAVAQYGLGNYNLYLDEDDTRRLDKFIRCADWLLEHLETNPRGRWVWMHHFDWDYQQTLGAPWYSGLAQGQGLSVLTRAFQTTSKRKYLEAAEKAYQPFRSDIEEGGVIAKDREGNPWIEEYIVIPPTHILNGFIWALWGIYDYYLLTQDEKARQLWQSCLTTLEKNLIRYDTGYWSLYDLSQNNIPNVASFFYHQLHIVQMQAMSHLTGLAFFREFALRWQDYTSKKPFRQRALFQKILFKLKYF